MGRHDRDGRCCGRQGALRAVEANHPNLHYDINRIALGAYVIDEERITGFSPGGPDVARAVLVYRFAGDLIREILILN